jgi:hypothetical protein
VGGDGLLTAKGRLDPRDRIDRVRVARILQNPQDSATIVT